MYIYICYLLPDCHQKTRSYSGHGLCITWGWGLNGEKPTSRIRAKRSRCVCKVLWEKHETICSKYMLSTPKAPKSYQNVGCCLQRSRETSNGWYAQQGGWVANYLTGWDEVFFLPCRVPRIPLRCRTLVYKLRFHIQEGDVQIAKFTYLHRFATFHLLYEIVLAFVSLRMLTFSHHRRGQPGILLSYFKLVAPANQS